MVYQRWHYPCFLFFSRSHWALVTSYNPGGLSHSSPEELKGSLESQGSGFVLCTSMPAVGEWHFFIVYGVSL